MKLAQLSLFIENKPGKLVAPCRVLANAGISIVTLSLADTGEFGILRLVVDRCDAARAALTEAGFVAQRTEVIALEVPDRPGGLAEVLTAIDSAGVSIEYMYAFTYGRDGRAILVFRFQDPDRAITALAGAGIGVVAPVAVGQVRE
ncbi:MAG: ACT domain-containing protein [Polyangiaceae bacterium]|nr:ACT domain-containing protein [Polyangiaceae bacterium]